MNLMLTLEVVDVPSATLSLGHLGPSSGAAELCFHSGAIPSPRGLLWKLAPHSGSGRASGTPGGNLHPWGLRLVSSLTRQSLGPEGEAENTVYLANLSTFPAQAAVRDDAEQSSFTLGVAMAARNSQTKPDLKNNSVLGPKS